MKFGRNRRIVLQINIYRLIKSIDMTSYFKMAAMTSFHEKA